MTFRLRKRGGTYRLEVRYGERARPTSGERERLTLSLGTSNGGAAEVTFNKIERALTAGPSSLLWRELRTVLPPETFAKLAQAAGDEPEQTAEVPRHTWQDLSSKFAAWASQRVALDKMRDSTRMRYVQTRGSLGEFLASRGIVTLAELSRAVVEDYKGGDSHASSRRKTHAAAVVSSSMQQSSIASSNVRLECELIAKNPVRLEGRPDDQPERGRRRPQPEDRVLLNPAIGCPLTRPRLYEPMLAVGRRAGVLEAHPHRFVIRSPWTCSRAARRPTTWRNCSAARSKSTTHLLCENCASVRVGSWKAARAWR